MPAPLPARLCARTSGTVGPALVFVHGFGCDQTLWAQVAPAFSAGHRVVLYDLAGCGQSATDFYQHERHGTLGGHADDLVALCDALDLRDVRVVGHSVGATIALLAACRRPELFAQLLLLAPSPCYLNDPPGYSGGFAREDLLALLELIEKNPLSWAGALAPLVMQNGDRPALSTALERRFCAMDPAVARHFAEVTFLSDHRADLPRVAPPAVIFQCRDDVIAPTAVGDYLHRHLRHSRLVALRATGHCPHVSHPDEVIRQLQDHLLPAAPVAA